MASRTASLKVSLDQRNDDHDDNDAVSACSSTHEASPLLGRQLDQQNDGCVTCVITGRCADSCCCKCFNKI